jgi:hypothetical protein
MALIKWGRGMSWLTAATLASASTLGLVWLSMHGEWLQRVQHTLGVQTLPLLLIAGLAAVSPWWLLLAAFAERSRRRRVTG